jgi:inosine-uridine nucleoside N-ribohydrolase
MSREKEMGVKLIQRYLSAFLRAGALLRHLWTAVVLLLMLLTAVSPQIVRAQSETPEDGFGPSLRPNSQLPRWIIDELIAENLSADDVNAAQTQHRPPGKPTNPPPSPSLIVDSDFGVDDTVAVAALLSLDQGIATTPAVSVTIQALVTVAGVTTVENATYNAELLLAQYGLDVDDIPVIVGAKKPQKRTLSSTGKLIHGPDGLWWLAQITQEQELRAASYNKKGKGSSSDAKKFYCKEADLSNATLLALGPLTNVAEAIRNCKTTFEEADGLQLIVLGGVDMTGTESPPMGNETPIVGNTTPVTEYNSWQDPEAAQYVFDFARPQNLGEKPVLDIIVIPQNAFSQYFLTDEIGKLAASENVIGRWLTFPPYGPPYVGFPGPLTVFAQFQADNGIPPGVPDLVAAAYAVVPAIQKTALVSPSVVSIFGDSKASGFVGGVSLMAQSVYSPTIDVFLGTTEQISQVYDDETLSNLADAVFANGEPFYPDNDLLEDFLFGAIVAPPNNAQVVAKIDPLLVRRFLLHTLTAPYPVAEITTPLDVSTADTETETLVDESTLDQQVFIPFIATE